MSNCLARIFRLREIKCSSPLAGGDHEGNAYRLTGPEAFAYDEIAAQLSRVLGRTISHVSLPAFDLEAAMLSGGMPEEFADRMLDSRARTFKDYAAEVAATGVLDAATPLES